MESAAEYGLRTIAVLVVLLSLFQFMLLLIGTGVGILVLFATSFVIVRASSSVAVLLALDFLNSQAIDGAKLSGILWIVGPASVLSVVFFDLALDRPTLWLLRRMQLYGLWVGIGEVAMGGLATTLMLLMSARFVPGAAGLPASSALVAGLTGSFILYYVELLSSDTGFGKAD